MLYLCSVCTKTYATTRADAIEAASGFAAWLDVVPYVAVIRSDTREARAELAKLEAELQHWNDDGSSIWEGITADEAQKRRQLQTLRREVTSPEVFYCCASCVADNDKPGKYQGIHGRNELGIALILYSLSMQGGEDDSMHAEGNGSAWQFGRYLLTEDSSGFVELHEHKDKEAASKVFASWYADGMGYQEDDAVIASDGSVYFGRKELDVSRAWNRDAPVTETRRYAAIALEMARSGFYPDVWVEYGYGVRLCQDFYSRTVSIDAILTATKTKKEEV